jgi:Mrp family chromosome partitioning ATPase
MSMTVRDYMRKALAKLKGTRNGIFGAIENKSCPPCTTKYKARDIAIDERGAVTAPNGKRIDYSSERR